MSKPERRFTVPADTRRDQNLAADPAASVWVEANAGSGKTFVLTRRVLRLLLSGAAPQTLLCLTYTKAAAAEMRARVTETLARWAHDGDEALLKDLAETLDRPATEEESRRARSLFAHALETPGGLKINTIHAFCEAVLQRFPREAGVPVDFTVIEEDERLQLMRAAREAVLAEGLKGRGEAAASVRALFGQLSDTQIETALNAALGAGRKLEPVLADPRAADANLRVFLGLAQTDTVEALRDKAVSEMIVPVADWPAILAICPPDPEKSRFEEKLAALDPTAFSAEHLFAVYLNKSDGMVPKNFPKGDFKRKDPALADRMLAEAERLCALADSIRAAAIAEQSSHLLAVTKAVLDRYEAAKRARSRLDFDDLIAHTATLLARSDVADWVRYKLDAGIDHILVDESQDTNAGQWAVVEALVAEYFSGEGTGRAKTVFAVGDPKQSIYSFQGAEPALFISTGEKLGRRAREAGATWRALELKTSFRTRDKLLDAVDRTVARPDIAAALFAREMRPIRHESARQDKGGTVTLWPTFPKLSTALPEGGWPLDPLENIASPGRRLANHIVAAIKGWISGTLESPIGRPVRPEDILILVQNRSGAFSEIVSALKKSGISSPGADRLPVSAHIAVDDLLGLGDVLLNPADDLMLAAILRSPLFAVSEEELFEIAHPRGKDESLWSALSRSEIASAKAAYQELFALRTRLDLDRPYEFYAHLLYGGEGLKRFHTRLGSEVDEVIAEFLDLAFAHEQSDQPSLTGFLARMRSSAVTIKRDLVQSAAGVRIMTVHGAKGLEAPIVILADATTAPKAAKDQVFFAPQGAPSFFLYCGSKPAHCLRSSPLRETVEETARAEYWRNLYVAMTRAEDALFVTGTTDEKDDPKNTWYTAIKEALVDEADPLPEADGLRYPKGAASFDAPPQPPSSPSGSTRGPMPPLALPSAATDTPQPFSRPTPSRKPSLQILSPSGLGASLPSAPPLQTAGERLLDADAARRRGIALHALLQHMTSVPRKLWADVVLTAAATLLPDDAALVPGVADDAMAILTDSELSVLFTSNARSEVSFSFLMMRDNAPMRLEGRIDRLLVEKDRALVVDFKSDANPPADAAGVSAAYALQLALYRKVAQRLLPGLTVDAAILWTEHKRLMQLDNPALDALVAGVTLA